MAGDYLACLGGGFSNFLGLYRGYKTAFGGYLGAILGLYRGYIENNGKENGDCHNGLYRVYRVQGFRVEGLGFTVEVWGFRFGV